MMGYSLQSLIAVRQLCQNFGTKIDVVLPNVIAIGDNDSPIKAGRLSIGFNPNATLLLVVVFCPYTAVIRLVTILSMRPSLSRSGHRSRLCLLLWRAINIMRLRGTTDVCSALWPLPKH